MIFRNQGSSIKKSNSLSREQLIDIYGLNSYEFTQKNKEEIFICSKSKDLDLIELDQLLQTVGWSRRPIRRVKRALDFSILVVGLWRHDNKFPRLVGFARCTGDGILEATVWDVAVNPVYQGLGLGKELMKYILKELIKRFFEKSPVSYLKTYKVNSQLNLFLEECYLKEKNQEIILIRNTIVKNEAKQVNIINQSLESIFEKLNPQGNPYPSPFPLKTK